MKSGGGGRKRALLTLFLSGWGGGELSNDDGTLPQLKMENSMCFLFFKLKLFSEADWTGESVRLDGCSHTYVSLPHPHPYPSKVIHINGPHPPSHLPLPFFFFLPRCPHSLPSLARAAWLLSSSPSVSSPVSPIPLFSPHFLPIFLRQRAMFTNPTAGRHDTW